MVGVQTVVTPEVRDVANEFEDLVDRRDIPGLAFLAVGTAVGVALANEVVDMVMPRLGMNPDPQTSREFLAAGLIQLAWAAVLATIAATQVGSPLIFVTGILLAMGSAVIGGAQLFEWGQRALARFSAEGSTARRRGTGNPSASSSGSSSGRQRSSPRSPSSSGSTGMLATRG